MSSKFTKSVAVLAGGSAFGQVLLILISPILTRLYEPADFGTLAVYSAILNILVVFSCLRYEIAISLPKSDLAAHNLMAACFIVLLFLSALLFLTTNIFGENILGWLNADGLLPYDWLIPVGFFFSGAFLILRNWAIRKGLFRNIAKVTLRQAILMSVVQLCFYKTGSLALVVGQTVGQSAGLFGLAKSISIKKTLKSVRLKRITWLVVRYKNFPLYSTWTGAFNALGNQLPALIFAGMFGGAVAGFYVLAVRVLAGPASIIGQAVASVFLSGAADARRTGELGKSLVDVSLSLAMLSFPPTIFIILKAELLFTIVFGEKWVTAGTYSAILAPMLAMMFITSPISTVCAVLDRQLSATFFQATLLVVRILAIMVGVELANPNVAVSFFSAGSTICYTIFLVILTRLARGDIIRLMRGLLQSVVASSVAYAPLYFIDGQRLGMVPSAYEELILSTICLILSCLICYFCWRTCDRAETKI